MAAFVTDYYNGSPLIGSPIVYKVTAGSYNNAVFHRVKVKVYAALSGVDTEYTSIEMSSPSEEGETLKFDISSALRAIADKYEYTAEPPSGGYPYIKYYMETWDEYMINGISYKSTVDAFPDGGSSEPFGALMGKYSDMERLLAGEGKSTQKFTRKPTTSPEVVIVGETFIRPQDMTAHSGSVTQGQTSVSYDITTEGALTVDGASLYALPADTPDYYQLRFINGLGCMETLSVRSLRDTEVAIDTKEFTRAVQETFGTFSRGMATKQNDFEKWKMSSGPLDKTWQSWFIHEFLMARWVWIKVNTLWVPCHIIPDETVAGMSRVGSSLLEVQFTLKFDIAGSVMSALAI